MDTTNIFVAALPNSSTRNSILERINQHAGNLSCKKNVRWERSVDLHITLGYLRGIKISDISQILPHFQIIENHPAIHATVKSSTVYGSALCLQLEPLEAFLTLHNHLVDALEQSCQGIYQFNSHNHFDAHMTLGRLQQPKHLRSNAKDKTASVQWLDNTFHGFSFDVDEVAVLHRAPSEDANYQQLKTYALRSANSNA